MFVLLPLILLILCIPTIRKGFSYFSCFNSSKSSLVSCFLVEVIERLGSISNVHSRYSYFVGAALFHLK